MAHITRQSFDPLYYQIEKEILGEIHTGRIQSGDRLPSEMEIIRRFGVSRITARRVLEDLIKQGVAYSQQGRGTFVALPHTQEVSGFLSFTQDMRLRGLEPSSQVLFFAEIEPDRQLAKRLQLQPGETAYRLKRVRCADGAPVVLEISHVPVKLCPGLLAHDFSTASLYTILQADYDVHPAWADVELAATPATAEEAAALQIEPGEPVLSADRLTYTRTFTVVEAVHSVNGPRFTFYTGRQFIGE